ESDVFEVGAKSTSGLVLGPAPPPPPPHAARDNSILSRILFRVLFLRFPRTCIPGSTARSVPFQEVRPFLVPPATSTSRATSQRRSAKSRTDQCWSSSNWQLASA